MVGKAGTKPTTPRFSSQRRSLEYPVRADRWTDLSDSLANLKNLRFLSIQPCIREVRLPLHKFCALRDVFRAVVAGSLYFSWRGSAVIQYALPQRHFRARSYWPALYTGLYQLSGEVNGQNSAAVFFAYLNRYASSSGFTKTSISSCGFRADPVHTCECTVCAQSTYL